MNNQLTNLNISKNIKEKKCTLIFHGTYLTYHIKFKLICKFKIVAFLFFFFSNISIMPILLKFEFLR